MYLITCSWLCPSKLLREGDSIKFLQNKHWRSSGQKSNEPVEEALFPLPRMHAFPKLPFQIRVVAHLQTRGPPWNIDCALSSLLVLLLFPSLVTSPLSPKLPLLVTGWLAGSALLSWKAGNSWQLGPEMTALPAVAAPCRSEYLAALAPHAAHAASRAHLAHLSGPCVFVYMCLTPRAKRPSDHVSDRQWPFCYWWLVWPWWSRSCRYRSAYRILLPYRPTSLPCTCICKYTPSVPWIPW